VNLKSRLGPAQSHTARMEPPRTECKTS
jgi:hypothetical protein